MVMGKNALEAGLKPVEGDKSAARGVRKFSVAFAFLAIIPNVLVLFFILAASVKMEWLGLNQALFILLGALVIVYYMLRRLASRIEGAVGMQRKKD